MELILPRSSARKNMFVCSHERSGTHFLMNSIAANFPNYKADTWIDFDMINVPHAAENMDTVLDQLGKNRTRMIFKCHYAGDFFHPVLTMRKHLDNFVFLYIYRDPHEVMRSYHRHVQDLYWLAGPKTYTWEEFARAEPIGGCMRYQWKQHKTMMSRWISHVRGWMETMPQEAQKAIIYVNYKALNHRFEDTITKIGKRLGMSPPTPAIRPTKDGSMWLSPGYTQSIKQRIIV